MTTTPHGAAQEPLTRLRWLTLVLAVAQAAGPGLFALLSPRALDSGATNEPQITPAGYAFSIWGLICLASLVAAVALCRTAAPVSSPRRLHRDLAVTFAGFDLWLLFAGLDWLWATVVVFATMATALVDALVLLAAQHASDGPGWLRPLLRGTVGLYAGWTSVAVFVNLAAALVDAGVSVDGDAGRSWQLLLVVAAGALAFAVVRTSGRNLAYLLAVEWALVAAAIGATGQGADVLAAGAVGVGVVLALACAWTGRPGALAWPRGASHAS